jgi:O-acetyl-ADP-ribose deacetylase (regulator of RNase III)
LSAISPGGTAGPAGKLGQSAAPAEVLAVITFTAGDLLQTGQAYIAQGVAEGNQEGLGTGLALKISRKWPDVQAAFKRHARSGRFRGGDLWACPPADGRPGVIYLATQPDMYHAKLPYLRKALRRLARWADGEEIKDVGLPKIGAGLGKLSWPGEVKPLMVELLADARCLFVVYEDFTLADEQGDS